MYSEVFHLRTHCPQAAKANLEADAEDMFLPLDVAPLLWAGKIIPSHIYVNLTTKIYLLNSLQLGDITLQFLSKTKGQWFIPYSIQYSPQNSP